MGSDPTMMGFQTRVAVTGSKSPPMALSISACRYFLASTKPIGDLANFQTVKFDNVLQALKQVSAFLSQFAAFEFLNDDIPLLGISVNDLLSVADKFAKAVEDIEKNPAGGIQLLQQKISQKIWKSLAQLSSSWASCCPPALTCCRRAI